MNSVQKKDNTKSTYANPLGKKDGIKELEIPLDPDIIKLEDFTTSTNVFKNDLTDYNEVIEIIINVRKNRDITTHNINSFNFDMKNELYKKGYKINYYSKYDSKKNINLIKIYKDNLSMTIDCKTLELVFYNNYKINNNIDENNVVNYKNGKLYPTYEKIFIMEELYDGTKFYVSFDTFKKEILVTTTKNLLGDNGTVYDGINHKEFFATECDKRGYDLNLILNYFIEKNINNMVIVFTLRHFSTPIPLDVEENSMKISDVYQINNNVDILNGIDSNYTKWKESKFQKEEFLKNIKTHISKLSEFIIRYDVSEFVSFCVNAKIGVFEKKKLFQFDEKVDMISQFSTFFNNCNNKFKGFLVVTNTNIEMVYNYNYLEILKMRPNISLNKLEDYDKHVNKIVFKYQLELFYNNISKEKVYENYSVLVKKFKFDEYLKENTRKVNEWISNLVELFNDIHITKSKDKTDIPNCYKYKIKDEKFYKDFVYMMYQDYKLSLSNRYGKKVDINYIVKKNIYDNVLRNYFENDECIYGEMYGKIMTPDKRTKKMIFESKKNNLFMKHHEI